MAPNKKPFKKIYIELSDICGLQCSFCPNPKNIRGVIPLELFEKVCKEAAPLTPIITFHVLGDPCKLKNLNHYLSTARRFSLKVDLVTSGVYLCDFETLLQDIIYQISISLDAGLDNHNKLNQHRYIQKILEFCRYKCEKNSEVFLNLRIQDSTLEKHQNLIKPFLESFECVSLETLKSQGRTRLFKKSFLNIQKTFKWPNLNAQNSLNQESKTPYCYGLIKQIAILSNGVVVPCCMDTQAHINLGDLNHTPLKDILKSQKAMAIKTHFLKGEALELLCKNCSYPLIRYKK
ncbi:radical SAM/SPASM domain-containing protein [Helicobacter pylori]|uniref:radical SAM/SPASM domain-containing protein n=1 Tax=Helicobacter pylori TaxID=210 RepID=UPI000BED67C6|nr:radical SAM/SPASM domain-containing protein [Helicobacter pylori]MBM0596892.1 radical SAM/SPASM domain-containing protein [Helicobacter pylori]MBM0599106.1 radical SAM/SPASM domain-containing protein [Helicobacter pylori]MBM0606417.1 radical SAM/SPASM domain-containing protein [Helicobacter pylori]PDW54684.1 radical SAM protein [Helicobacter pylori]PDX55024.1 radical SAM protein [Helicobacter pylori]